MIFLYEPRALCVMMDAIGDEKFIFGTDYPLVPPSRYMKECEKIELDGTNRKKILGENFLNIVAC